MDYFDVSKMLDEALNEVLEPENDSNLLADMSSKLFNQGARMLFYKTLIKVAAFKEGE